MATLTCQAAANLKHRMEISNSNLFTCYQHPVCAPHQTCFGGDLANLEKFEDQWATLFSIRTRYVDQKVHTLKLFINALASEHQLALPTFKDFFAAGMPDAY